MSDAKSKLILRLCFIVVLGLSAVSFAIGLGKGGCSKLENDPWSSFCARFAEMEVIGGPREPVGARRDGWEFDEFLYIDDVFELRPSLSWGVCEFFWSMVGGRGNSISSTGRIWAAVLIDALGIRIIRDGPLTVANSGWTLTSLTSSSEDMRLGELIWRAFFGSLAITSLCCGTCGGTRAGEFPFRPSKDDNVGLRRVRTAEDVCLGGFMSAWGESSLRILGILLLFLTAKSDGGRGLPTIPS